MQIIIPTTLIEVNRMSKRLFSILFAVTLAAMVPGLARADAVEDYQEGLSAYQSGNYRQAETKFRDALEKNPKSISSVFMIGETLSKDIRKLRDAEGWYKKVIQAAGTRDKLYITRAHYSLGVLYIQLGLYQDALAEFRDLTAVAPDFYGMAKVYNYMGVAKYNLSLYDEALKDFKTSIRLDRNLLEASFNMKSLQSQLSMVNEARYYERMGDFDSAKTQYEKALAAYPNYVAAWYHLGLLSLKRKEYAQAIRYFTRAKALYPAYLGTDELPYQMAVSVEGRGEAGDAEEALRTFRGMPGYKDARLRAGLILLDKGQLDEAEEELVAVAKNRADRKGQAEAMYQLGRILTIKDNQAGAKEFFKKARDLNPAEERYKN